MNKQGLSNYMKHFDRLLNWLASYYVNNKIFSKEIAKKMPIYCSWHTKWSGLKKGCIQLDTDEIYKSMIQIGFDRIAKGLLGGNESSIIIEGSGKIIFSGKADLSQGISIYVHDNAILTLGSGIYTNGYCSIRCSQRITIGNNAMWGWNVEVMDSDGHPIYNSDNQMINAWKDIVIGNNVWLASHSKVLKGSIIPDGCIVGMGSLVTRQEETKNAIIAGCPAKVVKEGVFWDRGKISQN